MAKLKPATLEEARALAEHWDAMWEQDAYENALAARFRDASASQLVAMWESYTNEKGQTLSPFEFRALCACWIETFGTLPPDREPETGDTPATPPEPEPEDDKMLRMPEVVRLTGVSESTIERMVKGGRFPKPMYLSTRSIGWPAREVKAWLRQLDEQRRAPRQ